MRTNSEIINIVIKRRKELGLTASELAEKVGIAKSAMSRYENQSRQFPLNKVTEFARALNLTPEYLLGINFKKTSNVSFPEKVVKIPVLGTIAAGTPILAEQNMEEHIHVLSSNLPSGEIVCLNVKGDSMAPGIPDGASVLIRVQPEVEEGEIAAVLVNGNTEATLKRVKHQDNMVLLIPDNKEYSPIVVTEENPARIIGKAIKVAYDL